MIKNFIKGRVYTFVDAANILYSQQTLGWRIDYQKLREYLEKECELKGIYFYTGKIGKDHRQKRFLEKMATYGYQVRAKEVKMIRMGPNTYERKGDLDAELIIDALKNIDNFDTCILMSGDSDFAPLVDELKKEINGLLLFQREAISLKNYLIEQNILT